MADFNVRSDSVNVEQIMEQIRARIREKRGVDYTEEELRALATVKLEKFLDPRGIRSDLIEQFHRTRVTEPPQPAFPTYVFEQETLFETHRAPLRWIRALLRPVLKLFFNPGPLIQALHTQADWNAMYVERDAQREARREAVARDVEQLRYEVLHNLVVEMTRTGIEVKNLKMRVESLTGRLEFNERRARALESLVVYKPDAPLEVAGTAPTSRSDTFAPASPNPAGPSSGPTGPSPASPIGEGPGQRSRRRRRRRGRRGGAPATTVMGMPKGPDQPAAHDSSVESHPAEASAAPTTGPAEAGTSENRSSSDADTARPSGDSSERSGQAEDQ